MALKRRYHLPQLQFYQLAAGILLLGFMLGIFFAHGIHRQYPGEITVFFEQIKSNLEEQDIGWLELLQKILQKRLQSFGLLLIFLISILRLPYMGGFLLYQGTLGGFLTGSVLWHFGRKGILLAAGLFFPQSFFYLSAWYLLLNKGWQLGRKKESQRRLWQEIPCLFLSLALLIVGCTSEAFINTWLLRQIFILL